MQSRWLGDVVKTPLRAEGIVSMSQQWFVKRNGISSGPFSSQQLKALAAAGELSEGDLVSLDAKSFVSARRVRGIVFAKTRPIVRPAANSSEPPDSVSSDMLGASPSEPTSGDADVPSVYAPHLQGAGAAAVSGTECVHGDNRDSSRAPALRVFVSSPGDVAEERFIAERVLKRIADEFAFFAEIVPILWEHEPLLASDTFQGQIYRPSKTDIVICILWSRLGTRLSATFKRADGTPYDSGTEFEFEDALEGYRVNGKPDLLVYRKQAEPTTGMKNIEAAEESLRQYRLLDEFIRRVFHGADGTLIAAFHPFDNSAEFEVRLEIHLRKLINERLQRLGVDLGALEPISRPTWTAGSPFRGLEVFDFEHESVFFGRTKAVSDVLQQLKQQAANGCAFVLVLGESGCGKSSLVRAGVLPLLVRPSVIEGIGLWRRAIFRPSERTGDLFDGLAAALLSSKALPEVASDGTTASEFAAQLRQNPLIAPLYVKGALSQAASHLVRNSTSKLQPEARLVLVIDQLEELFTTELADGQLAAFVAAIRALAESGKTWVIATLRSDFYQSSGILGNLKTGKGQYHLQPPASFEVAQLIRRPALAAGLRFEEDLQTGHRLDDLLRDAASANLNCLPLLEFTLEELYRLRRGALLTLQDYREMGGIEGALARRANEVFNSLSETTQAALPIAFRHLATTRGDGTDVVVRKTSPLAVFDEAARALVDAFVAARLLIAKTVDDIPVVELAHEALLTCWQPLVDWLRSDRELLGIRARIAASTVLWSQNARPRDLLLQPGKQLEEGLQLRAARFQLSENEASFISASKSAANYRQRLRNTALVALSVLTVLAVIGGVAANAMRRLADERQQVAVVARNEAENAKGNLKLQLGRNRYDRGCAERHLGHTFEAVSLLASAFENARADESLRHSIRLILATWHTEDGLTLRSGGSINALAFNSNSSTVASAGEEGAVQLWNVYTGQPEGKPLEHKSWIFALVFNSQGDRIASGGLDGATRIWDTATCELIGQPLQHMSAVNALAFNPDGSTIAAGYLDGSVRMWSVTTGHLLNEPLSQDASVDALAFSPDGALLAIGSKDGSAKIWDTKTGVQRIPPLKHGAPVSAVAFVPPGSKVVTGGLDGIARIWDIGIGTASDETLNHKKKIDLVRVSADGAVVSLGSLDGTVSRWDIATHKLRNRVAGNASDVFAVVLSPDGERVATGGLDGQVLLQRTTEGRRLLSVRKHGAKVYAVASRPEGSIVASGCGRGAVWWDLKGTNLPESLSENQGPVFAVAVSADGSKIVTGGADWVVQVLNTETGRRACEPLLHESAVYAVAIGPDSKTVATGSRDGVARIWDVDQSAAMAKPLYLKHRAAVYSVAYSPNGSLVATGCADRTARLWDSKSGRPKGEPLSHSNWVRAVAFSPDGAVLATGGEDSTVRFWNVESGQPVGEALEHGRRVNAVAFSPDGTLIASGSDDSTARLWDVKTGQPIGGPVVHSGAVTCVAFALGGTRLVTGCADETVRVWEMPAPLPEECVEMFAKIRSGMYINSDGQLERLSRDEWMNIWSTMGREHKDWLLKDSKTRQRHLVSVKTLR